MSAPTDPLSLSEEVREAAAQPDNRIGPYVLLDPLGEGGCGVVYRAWDTAAEREVALKVVEEPDAAARERFAREVEATARLDHPHIVRLLGHTEAQGQLLLATELVRGAPLHAVVAARRPDVRQAARWIADVAGALHYAHERQVLHRDVKPHNVMIDARGDARILDFGLVRFLDRDSDLTRSGATVGTLAFMPPEQIEGGGRVGLDARADIYSLGATLYYALAGRPPFELGMRGELIQRIRTQPPRELARTRQAIPPDLEAICLRCLAKLPGDRYPSARHVREALERFLRGTLSDTRADSTSSAFAPLLESRDDVAPARRGGALAGVGVVVVLLGVGIAATQSLLRTEEAPLVPPPQDGANPDDELLALERALAEDPDPLHASRTALALCARGGDRALRAVRAARHRFGWLSAFARKVEAAHPELDRGDTSEVAVGFRAWRAGDLLSAQAAFDRALSAHQADPSLWIYRGALEAEREVWDRAHADLQRARELDPTSAQAWVQQGELELRRERRRKAFVSFEKALTLDPRCPEAWAGRGRARRLLGDPAKAVGDLDQALRLDPTWLEAIYQRGVGRHDLGDATGAAVDAQSVLDGLDAVESDAFEARATNLLGAAKQALGDLAGARAAFERAVALDALDAFAWNNLGLVKHRQGDAQAALPCLDRAILQDPTQGLFWMNRGNALKALGRTDDALRDLDRAIELLPDDGRAWINRGLVLLQQGKADQAMQSLARATELAPEVLEAWSNRAALRVELGQLKEADADYTRALELAPGQARLWVRRAQLRQRMERLEEAESDLARALELDPRDARAWTQRGHLLLYSKRPDEAIGDYDRAIALEPTNVGALINRGVAKQNTGDPSGALADFDRVLRLDPDSTGARVNRSVIRLNEGDFEGALDDLNEALRRAPGDPFALLKRARYSLRVRQPERARADLERILEVSPRSQWARQAQALLTKIKE